MTFGVIVSYIADIVLYASCIFILVGCLYLTFRLKFVQLRFFPGLFKLLKNSILNRSEKDGEHTIKPHKALFTAMSTTLGISTIVGPVIAISLGGPGAMLGFLLTSIFGSAATYAEVSLSIRHRRVEGKGIKGGPMQYLQYIFSKGIAKWYAVACLILMTAWSGAQANQLAAIFNSPLLGSFRVPTMVSGIVIAALVMVILIGGIKRIGAFSSKLVPFMFVLYVGSCFWIVFANLDKMGGIFYQMVHSALTPYSLASGVAVGGIMSALRWGVFKGLQTNEAGIGTQTIPHSMAETSDPVAQGTLAMLSTYTAGFVAFLSGSVTLLTETWLDPELPLGISMVAGSFKQYFSFVGVAIVAISSLLFGFGTILGNSFNGSQCFSYLTNSKWIRYYFAMTAVMIFLGSIGEVATIWSLVDLVLVGMAIPHMAGLILYAHREPKTILSGFIACKDPAVSEELREEERTCL